METSNFNIRPGNLVFDMDEILFNISPYMYKTARMHWDKFFPFLKNLGPLTDEQVLARKEFMFTDWLIKDEIKNDENISKPYQVAVWKTIKDLVFTDTMYDDLEPTHLAKETLMNPEFLENPAIKSCIILTRYIETHPGMLEGKKKILEKYFNHPKITMLPVKSFEKKSEALKNAKIDWSLIFDDEIVNIRDYAENFDLERREFMIPRFGYNELPLDLKLLIQEKGGTVTYYDKTI